MRLDILNRVEAEQYALRVLDNLEDYSFRGQLCVSTDDPELAYERVNLNAELQIDGMSGIGESFDEDQFSLDIIKYDYAEKFVELITLCDCLENDGYEWGVEISMDVAADYPKRVVEKIETKEIYPTVEVEGIDGPITISYLPVDSTSFQVEGEDSDLAELIADCL